MSSSFPWLPVGTEIFEGVSVGRVIVEGVGYQLIATRSKEKQILVIKSDAKWINPFNSEKSQIDHLIENGLLKNLKWGEEIFWVGVFENDVAPILVGDIPNLPDFSSSDQLLKLAEAISKMNEKYEGVDWSRSIYLPGFRFCIATEFNKKDEDRTALAVKILTGGVPNPTLSPSQIRALNPWITVEEIELFFYILNLKREGKKIDREKITPKTQDFSLPGRPKLESFFKEHVIDYNNRRDEYKTMGIKQPNGILLSGRPGTGKTYAVERLAEFLGWPVYEADVAAIGSPYIHQTSKKLRELFDVAAENAPSIFLMEEIDALAGSRDEIRQSHKVEETTQLLRLVEKAAEKEVLIIATTTRSYVLDDALMRRGRFDHIIEIEMPKVKEISSALEALLEKRPTVGGLNIEDISTRLKGRPMSDVAWVVNEAARIAVKQQKEEIDDFCLMAAVKNLEVS